jgi:organic hydroperoxide reductase OsmC/OhrA
MTDHSHHYTLDLVWTGNRGEGTKTYQGYGRDHRVTVPGKPEIMLSADAAFRGDPKTLNPEDLLVAALSSCHMLSYLALCALAKIEVSAYRDKATGTMVTDTSGGGRFTEVTLHPHVTITDAGHLARAIELHEKAGKLCFIASSVNFPVRHEATVEVNAEFGMRNAE